MHCHLFSEGKSTARLHVQESFSNIALDLFMLRGVAGKGGGIDRECCIDILLL